MRGALITSAVVVVLGLISLLAFPHSNYLLAPGVIVALVLNGGGHEHSAFGGWLFWPTVVLGNWILYFGFWLCVARLYGWLRK